MKENGGVIDTLASSDIIPLETISSCTNSKADPIIKSYYDLEMESGKHLFQLIKNEATKGNSIHSMIVNKMEE